VPSVVVRVWLPDRPGALGLVASRIGAIGGDIVGIDVLERSEHVAVDEFAVVLPDRDLVALLVREIEEVDGASVEEWREVATFPDPRLDALESSERSLLEDCAIVGGSGPIAAVLALAARPDAGRLLDDLAERDFLLIDHDEFHFKSELIREIAYGTLTKAERARRHALVAPVLAARGEQAADQAAHHLATAAELMAKVALHPAASRTVSATAARSVGTSRSTSNIGRAPQSSPYTLTSARPLSASTGTPLSLNRRATWAAFRR